uniref:Golgi associated, gamma adaptin ear containing, ARF binding protein 3a n=1 Tax=Gasterosteus aculeatus aculeatus TaxID=481459 RepID=A0AAQ4RB75_GASAC
MKNFQLPFVRQQVKGARVTRCLCQRGNMADDGESLESWLNKATNPSNRQEDWEYIMGFCDQINKELEGPQISVRLLGHKIQSPQEWEAIQALTVLEACMKNCGRRFHNEVGKFRFLNELIKVVSPKYLGDKVSEGVKTKVIEMLYSWTVSLPDEAKVVEAYQMLKSQGIVLTDPEVPLDATFIPSPSPQPKNPLFDDEKKSKRLAELLKSKKPEDLQEANRLIKNMVKEDEVRTLKEKKQRSTLEAVNSSVKLLTEMLSHFSPEESTDGDKELIRELYGDCDKLRQTVFQLATETEDNDSSLGDILQASDDLSHVVQSYKKIVEEQIVNGGTEDAQQTQLSVRQGTLQLFRAENCISSLCMFYMASFTSIVTASPYIFLNRLISHLVEIYDSGHNLDFFESTLPSASASAMSSLFPDALPVTADPIHSAKSSIAASASSLPGPVSSTSPVSTLSISTTSVVFPQSFSSALTSAAPARSFHMASPPLSASSGASHPTALSHNLQDLAMLDLGSKYEDGIWIRALAGSTPPLAKSQAEDSTLLRSLSPILPLSQASQGTGREVSLANVFVPLDAIKPSKVCPVTAYDKNGVRVLLHFASDCPAGRPDVLVMVASMLNTAPRPVRNIALQAAVPKTMKVRLQAPTATELAPFNPILPPAAITQVMLLANPLKEKVRMRYKLMFTLGEQPHSEVGEVNEFPPTDRWGAL